MRWAPIFGNPQQSIIASGLAAPAGVSYFPMMASRAAEQWASVPPNRATSFLLFAVVALAPFPFGSTDPTTVAFWCIVLGVALACANPRALHNGHLVILAGAGFVVLGYALVLHEQLSAHPWLATPHPLWREAASALQTPLEPSVSIARNQPFFALGASLAALLALLCALIVCADRVRARQLLQVVAWSGAGYAVFGIGSFLIDPTKILWRDKLAYTDSLTSTFVNRNTAAVYFGSCAIVWLLLLAEHIRRLMQPGDIRWKSVPRRLLSAAPREVATALSALLLCLAAMFMTGSRAGVVLSLMALVFAFTIFFRRRLPRRTGWVTAFVVGGAVVLLLLQVLGGSVGGRFEAFGLVDRGRLETYRSTLDIIRDYPWFGTGLGTFGWAYPTYRSPNISMWGIWDRAHSTPLELAADLGLPLAGLVGVAWIGILAILVRGVRIRRRALAFPVAALSIALLALLHSSVDFSLQIPGYAIIVFALVGAGLSQSFTGKSAKGMEEAADNIG